MNFDNIRPYDDREACEALGRVAASGYIDAISGYLYPGQDPAVLRSALKEVNGVDDFQSKVMYGAVKTIIEKTSDGLTYDGLEYFEGGKTYLMLSTHRDIVLDPALIQWVLKANDMPLTEIAAGDNLISTQLLEDLMRSNRMIKVIRSSNPREVYDSSVVLSRYMRERIHDKERPASIWIAHRNGRTKDGHDATEQGLVKMISLSGVNDFAKNISELNIMPVAISYEIESCDLQKAIEVYVKRSTGSYQKKPGEDTQSIIYGIIQQKGRIHISFCPPITEAEIARAASFEKNERYRHLAEIIDARHRAGFRIWPYNIVAAEIVKGEKASNPQETAAFLAYVEKRIEEVPASLDRKAVRDILIEIYAAPVLNV